MQLLMHTYVARGEHICRSSCIHMQLVMNTYGARDEYICDDHEQARLAAEAATARAREERTLCLELLEQVLKYYLVYRVRKVRRVHGVHGVYRVPEDAE